VSASVSTGKNSKQDFGTPVSLITTLKKHVNITVDLAAHSGNHKCPVWYGPGGVVRDALAVEWKPLLNDEWYFLNMEYCNIPPWYEKCAESTSKGARIVSLVPMDAAPSWFDFVPGKAGIWHIQGRIKFDGAEQSGAKDSALHFWAPEHVGTFRVWNWRKDKFLI